MFKEPETMDEFANESIEARLEKARRDFPGFALMNKSDSKFMKAIFYGTGMFLWNRSFMTNYTTTIGVKMYIPKPFKGPHGLALLDHELQHIADSKHAPGPLWSIGYLFPQCLAALALLAFWSHWWLLALLALGPWPAPFRVTAEFRAYRKQLITLRSYGVPVSAKDVDRLKDVFCGWGYWRMSWSWEGLRRQFVRVVDPTAVFGD